MRLLEWHASTLGLGSDAETGRLATARRVAALLDQLTAETDDVVLVELLAAADLGVDDTTASRSMSTARSVVAALTGTQWTLLDAVGKLADDAGRAGPVPCWSSSPTRPGVTSSSVT